MFEKYLSISQSQKISSEDLNKDILQCLKWQISKKSFSDASQSMVDDIFLKIVSIQIIHDQVFIHSSPVSPEIFTELLNIILCLVEQFKPFKEEFYQIFKSDLQYYVKKIVYQKAKIDTIVK